MLADKILIGNLFVPPQLFGFDSILCRAFRSILSGGLGRNDDGPSAFTFAAIAGEIAARKLLSSWI